jgi:hypothetical protein
MLPPKEVSVSIVERVKRICLTPNSEWPVIAEESTPAGGLIAGYVLPLAAIGAVAGVIGGALIGYGLPLIGTYRVPIVLAVGGAVFGLVMSVVGVFVLSVIINALAPSFGAEKNGNQALKVAVYSYTPAWVAGVFQILPLLSLLAVLGALYGLYLMYLGLLRLMKCPQDKAIGYTVVVVICAIVVSFVTTAIGGLIVGAGVLSSGVLSGGFTSRPDTAAEVRFDKDSPMGRLQELGKKLEETGKKAEAAEKSGDEGAQIAAAVESFATLLGGGRKIDPIEIDQLKAFVPDTFAGLPKTSNDAEKTGIAGVVASKARATYGDGANKQATLEVMDSGGVSGLMALAGWASIQGESEDDSSSERTHKVDGRVVHEKVSKRAGGTNEFAILLGDRFVVTATGEGVDLSELKAALSRIDLARLESMKDVGVEK